MFQTTLTTLTFRAADGTEYDLRDEATGGQRLTVTAACPVSPYTGQSRGKVFVSADGSGATFISDADIFDQVDIPAFTRTFSPSGTLMLRDGIRYRIDSGVVTSIIDRNGNTVTLGSSSATDSLGRSVTFEYDVTDSTYGLCDRIRYKGFGEADRIIYITKTNLVNALRADQTLKTYSQLFSGLNGAGNYQPSQYNPIVVSSVILPNLKSYEFRYNSYGELARVVLPTGGAFEYDMAPGSGVITGNNGQTETKEIYRRVQERRTYTDGADATSLTSRTVFTVPSATESTVVEERFDGSGTLKASSKHFFNGHPKDGLIQQVDGDGFPLQTYPDPLEGREVGTETYDTNGVSATTLMQTVATSWQTGTTLGGFAINPRVSATTVTLHDLNLVSQKSFLYDQCIDCNPSFNNQTDVYEYDYGSGAPGALIRRTHTDYVPTASYVNANIDPNLGAHLRSLPSQRWVSTDAGGTIKKALSTYEYDNHLDDARHKPLVSRSGITGHDATYSSSFTLRGNVTGVTSFTNAAAQTGPITVSTQYDVAGNAVASIDGLGKLASVTFSDSFCNPSCGGTFIPNTFAFATATISPVPDQQVNTAPRQL